MERTQVPFEKALKLYHEGYTVVMEFYEPGATRWYAAQAYSIPGKYPDQLPEVSFGELSNVKFFVLDFYGEQLKFDI